MATEVKESKWFGRSLDNYKSMHEKAARDKEVWKQFSEAKTLTQARKILYGYKKKNTR